MITPIVVDNAGFAHPRKRTFAIVTLVVVATAAAVGVFVSTSGDGTDPATVLTHQHSEFHTVGQLAVLPDGRLIADEGFDHWAWDIRDGSATGYQMPSTGDTLAVLPDGRIVSAGSSEKVYVWEPAEPVDANAAGQYRGHPLGALGVAVIAPDRVLSVATGELRVWGADTLRTEVAVDDPTFEPRAVVGLTDGRAAIGEWGGTIRIWSPDRPDELPIAADAGGAGDASVSAIGAFPDGRIAIGTDDGAVRIAALDGALVDIGRVEGEVTSLLVLADGRIATGWFDHHVRIWDPAEPGADPMVLRGHEGSVRAMVQLPDGRLATGGNDGSIRIWDDAA